MNITFYREVSDIIVELDKIILLDGVYFYFLAFSHTRKLLFLQ